MDVRSLPHSSNCLCTQSLRFSYPSNYFALFTDTHTQLKHYWAVFVWNLVRVLFSPLVGQLNRLQWDLLATMCLDHISIPTLVAQCVYSLWREKGFGPGIPCLSGSHRVNPSREDSFSRWVVLPCSPGSGLEITTRDQWRGLRVCRKPQKEGWGSAYDTHGSPITSWQLSGGTSLGIRVPATLPPLLGKSCHRH